MVSKKENINLPDEFSRRIAEKSGRNLRRALLMLESCKVQQLAYKILFLYCIETYLILK